MVIKAIRLIWLCGFGALFLVAVASAGGPAGHPQTLESDLYYGIQDYFYQEGYLGEYKNGQGFQRGVSAYLWDNRHWFEKVDFHNYRNVDAVVCLLHKKGYPGFESYVDNPVFSQWCEQLVKKP